MLISLYNNSNKNKIKKEFFKMKAKKITFDQAAKRGGVTKYKGIEYALLEEARFAGLQNIRIDDSIYVLDSNNYVAECIDTDGNDYIAYFVVKDDNVEEEDSCDWENASYVEKI